MFKVIAACLVCGLKIDTAASILLYYHMLWVIDTFWNTELQCMTIAQWILDTEATNSAKFFAFIQGASHIVGHSISGFDILIITSCVRQNAWILNAGNLPE